MKRLATADIYRREGELFVRAAVERHRNQREDEWPGPNRRLRNLWLTAEFPAREGRIGGRKEY